MRTLHSLDGDITIYSDFMGKPSVKVGNEFIPLVAVGHKRASKIRTDQFALAFDTKFNFWRVVVQPHWRLGEVIFERANGEHVFTLKEAHGDG